jgi:hypothetical protein
MHPGHSRTAVLPARLRYWSIATQDRDESEMPSESAILQAGHEGKELITHAPRMRNRRLRLKPQAAAGADVHLTEKCRRA